jgi:hypothetical protein
MNKPEAYNILARHLNRFLNYSELVPRVEAGQIEQFEARGESNITYQIEVQFDWEVERNGPIRVFGSIYDASAGGFFPLTQSLLLTPKEAMPQKRNGEAGWPAGKKL